ncbi:MAG: 8-amino-7-oxononanoate synthase [Bacteroidetes bacterium HGW-Bacteroidetes-12]|nr:MAG: 8-amino-7-oxononanoate synthase [Bacteroidetes bacterium HGW-Bacteroidetes-12]
MDKTTNYINKKLSKRKQENAFRELKQQGVETPCLVDFCSNDYLGFAKEKTIHHYQQGDMSPCYNDNTPPCYGATGSRLISGNYAFTEEVERYLANFYDAEAALIFNSGYVANVGLFQCLPQRNDTVIYDEYIHASIRDGIRLSNAKSFAFKHNNLAALEQKLKHATGLIYVAVESIYSMDGDVAPLIEIAGLCTKYQVALLVDEAHAVGIFGDGKGLVAELHLENEVFARIATFGKAFGGHGAAILGSEHLKNYLINFSRAFIYTTALPLSSIATIKNAHEFLLQNKHKIVELKALISYFVNSTFNFQLSTFNSFSAIQCIIIKGNDAVKNIASKMQEKGFDVKPILSPTVPKGQERLRICLHSFNTKEQVDKLIVMITTETQSSQRK